MVLEYKHIKTIDMVRITGSGANQVLFHHQPSGHSDVLLLRSSPC